MIYSKTESDKLFDLKSINGYLRNRLNFVVIIAYVLNMMIGNTSYTNTHILWNFTNLFCGVIMIYGLCSEHFPRFCNKIITSSPQTHVYSLTQFILHIIANYVFIRSIMFYTKVDIIKYNIIMLCTLCIMYYRDNPTFVEKKP